MDSSVLGSHSLYHFSSSYMRVEKWLGWWYASQTSKNGWPIKVHGTTRIEAVKKCLKEVALSESNPVDDDYPND